MNKKDILVGRIYGNSNYPDTVYLGVAVRKHELGKKPRVLRKELVILKSDEPELVGLTVIRIKDGLSEKFWEQFSLTTQN
jgi:hypothetical protein